MERVGPLDEVIRLVLFEKPALSVLLSKSSVTFILVDANTVRLLILASFVKICVDVVAEEDGDPLVLSLCLFELFKSMSPSLCFNGQIKGLSSSFDLSVNHKKNIS